MASTTKPVSQIWETATGKSIQTRVQSSIREVAAGAAEDLGATAPKSTLPVRNTFAKLADSVQENRKGLFSQIDDATNAEFTNLQNKFRNVDQRLRKIAGTDDTLEENLFNQKVALNTMLDRAIEAAKKVGVSPEVADQARTAWKQQSALHDVDNAIKGSTTGNIKNAPEVVDPRKVVGRLQKLEVKVMHLSKSCICQSHASWGHFYRATTRQSHAS